jgi:hypothetical protein
MKIKNKDIEIIMLKDDKGVVAVKRIKPPVFYIGRKKFTEYDIRNLQLEVSKGIIPQDSVNAMNVKDENGQVLIFNENGTLKNTVKGYDIISRMVLDMIGNSRRHSITFKTP